MLLIIHNLPTQTRYSEVKAFIKARCNLHDFILDHLIYEGPQSRKVTIGLPDENDANKITKELDGLVFMGQKLYVEDIRKNKKSGCQDSSHSSQGYSGGNMSQNTNNTNPWASEKQAPVQPKSSIPPFIPNKSYNNPYMSGQRINQNPMLNDQGNSKATNDGNINTWPNSQPPILPAPAVPQYMQKNPYDMPFYMYGQSPQCSPSYGPGMMLAQPPYSAPSMSTMHNTNMPYSGPSQYDNKQQPKAVSNDTEPGYIPCANDNSQNKYNNESDGSRYFENKEQIHPDRTRPSCSRDACEYDARSLSYDSRYDNWNESDTYQQSGRKVPFRDDRCTEKNLKQPEVTHRNSPRNQSDRSGYKQLAADDRPPLRNEGSFENFKNDHNRYDSNNYYNSNISSNKFEYTNENSRYKWVKTKDGNAGNNANFGGNDDRMPSGRKVNEYKGNYTKQHPNSKNVMNESNKSCNDSGNTAQSSNTNEPVKMKTIYTKKAFKKYMDSIKSPIENRDETWKCQAISKIVKDAIEDSGSKNMAKKPGFMPFFKSLVRTRIDKMLGNRMAVPYETIVEEYDKTYPANDRKCFVLEAKAQYCKGIDVPRGATLPIRKLPVVVPVPEKRKAPPQALQKFAKKKPAVEIPRPPPCRAPSPGPLPKYPNADKKLHKKLKDLAKEEREKEIYTLEPKLKEALDSEMKQLEELYKSGCLKNDGGEDDVICKQIGNVSEELFKIIKLDITKRLLNVTCNLPLRMFVNGRFKVREIGPKLKPYGIISCKKTRRSKLCVVVCKDYPYYDYLSTQAEIDIGDGLIVTFKPLHLAGPRKRQRKNKNQTDNADHGSRGDEVDESGNDDVGDDDDDDEGHDDDDDDDEDDEGHDDDDDEGDDTEDDEIDTWHDDKNEDQKHVKIEIIDNKENNVQQQKFIEVKVENESIKNEDKTETVVQLQNDGDDDNLNLLKDIKELTKIIDDDAVNADEQKQVKYNADTIDVPNITQDDLEDY